MKDDSKAKFYEIELFYNKWKKAELKAEGFKNGNFSLVYVESIGSKSSALSHSGWETDLSAAKSGKENYQASLSFVDSEALKFGWSNLAGKNMSWRISGL